MQRVPSDWGMTAEGDGVITSTRWQEARMNAGEDHGPHYSGQWCLFHSQQTHRDGLKDFKSGLKHKWESFKWGKRKMNDDMSLWRRGKMSELKALSYVQHETSNTRTGWTILPTLPCNRVCVYNCECLCVCVWPCAHAACNFQKTSWRANGTWGMPKWERWYPSNAERLTVAMERQ